MAMIDNVDFLISHIRNSFITSDDTTMCELIIESEDYDRPDRRQSTPAKENSCHQTYSGKSSQHRNSDSGLDSFDSDLSNSMDIFPDMEYGHRRRSNTAQRLDRLKKEKRSQSKVKTITWKAPPTSLSVEELGQLFETKELEKVVDTTPVPRTSLLSQQLEMALEKGDNPFMEYAKFDGSSSVGMATKRIEIFLTMSPAEQRYMPMLVVVLSTARVHDLIGLICWQYSKEERLPKLQSQVDFYCLHIAEDDGEVDPDFPSLDNREPVSKFGFSKMALVEREEGSFIPHSSSVIVTVYAPTRGFNKIQVANTSIIMREILEKVMKRRRLQPRLGLSYKLERQHEAGSTVDLDSTLSSQDTLEFCLIRENSARGDMEEFDRRPSVNDVAQSLTSHQYKSYIVSMVHRFLRTSVDVQLGISGEKVEIDPVLNKGIFRQKPVTIDADNIVECSQLDVHKSSNRTAFRLVHRCGGDYKRETFEAEYDVAHEIVSKVNHIMDLRFSVVRKDFVEQQQNKKTKKRDSFRFS